MSKMKKLTALLLALTMVFCMSACGSKTPDAPAAEAPAEQAPAEQAPATTGWPNGKDVTFVIPARAGGGSDLLTRFITTAWDTVIDGTMVPVNYEVAEVGAQAAKNAKPDGLTLTTAGCQSIDMWFSGMSEVDPANDLVVVGKFIAGGPNAIVARTDAPYDNLTELKEYAEAHPNEVMTGVGLGSSSHFIFINIARAMGGIELNYVQAPNEADKLTNIASGSLDIANCSLNNAISYEADGKLKVLGLITYDDAVGKDAYQEGLSDAYLTTAEQGFTGADWPSGNYVCVPAGTDPALIEEINASLQQIVNDPGFVQGMQQMGQTIEMKGVAESQADFMEEYEFHRELTTIAEANVR